MNMKLDILEMEDRKAKFVVEGVRPYFVNALRRTLLAEVPKLAFDEITFYENTSGLFDEIIAHRLAMVPLQTDKGDLNMVGRVLEDGTPEYLIRYTLTKEGPGPVTSGDIECTDPAMLPADKDIPIVDLLEGQRLIFEATATLGTGTQHSKYQVANAVGYRYYPTAHIGKLSKEQVAALVDATPRGILGEEKGKLVVLDEERLSFADGHGVDIVKKDDFKVTYDDRKFLFQFETDGSLTAKDALFKALELLDQRYKAFIAEAEQIE